jgi:arylsulfatase A-like enzyme
MRGASACRWSSAGPVSSLREPFSDEPAINVDLYPTFLAAAKTAPSAKHPLDGANLLPLFQGEKQFEREAIFWHFPGYLNGPVPRGRDPVFRTRPVSVIRKGDWKLHLYHEEWQLDGGRKKLDTNHAIELYNLADDPGERNDLALTNPKKGDELLKTLVEWIVEFPAPLPTEINPEYRPETEKKAR